MNIPLPPQDVLLPDNHERKQIFYWLKQVSSWTAWNRIFGYYKTWADAAEKSVRAADNSGILDKSTIPYDDYVFILKGLAHFEEGVQRLREGDKRVFQYNSHGEFAMAGRAPAYWHKGIWGRGEMQIDYEHTPYWDEFENGLEQFSAASGECAMVILESADLDAAAPNIFGMWLKENLPKMHFPQNLSEVPSSLEDILVATGKTIPHSGIWEPVEAPQSKGFSLFRQPPHRGPFPIAGCMNYLHGGSSAPPAKQETETESLRANVVWRLLWRDDRYEDGTVLEEEREYRFMQPESDASGDTPASASRPVKSEPLVSLTSGQLAPNSGRWLPEDNLAGAIELQAGEPLPFREGRAIRWTLATPY